MPADHQFEGSFMMRKLLREGRLRDVVCEYQEKDGQVFFCKVDAEAIYDGSSSREMV